MVGRLHRGVTIERRSELDEIPRRPASRACCGRWSRNPRQLAAGRLGARCEAALLAASSAVLVVLLIACVNVNQMLLARRGEFAMHAALGAARMRLIRLMLTESLLLALVGGVSRADPTPMPE
jgi:hypothetical protein